MPDELPDFPALVPRVAAGEQAAARELVEALHPQVIRIVRGRLPRRSAEEDLAQEVFIKIFQRLSQYRGEVPFPHWVARIAVTTCIDQLRAQRRRPEWRLADLSEEEAALLEQAPGESARPETEALAARELLSKLLERLDPKDQLVITLLEIEQKTVAEISALTGWSQTLVKVRAFRARGRLRRALATLEKEERP